jgi:methylthioribose-1-phosphate isomerase
MGADLTDISAVPRTVDWVEGRLRLIDQNALPDRLAMVDLTTWQAARDAIADMTVRGAPAIGCTAALGMALAALGYISLPSAEFAQAMAAAAAEMRSARPTAVNLMWAVDRIAAVVAASPTAADGAARAEAVAVAMLAEDVAANLSMGRYGAELLPDQGSVLTHCNAGALATVGYGTALGVIRAAVGMGKAIHVYSDETRPRLQGMRLTTWELQRDGIPVTAITDSMAAVLMRQGRIACVVVGADRIAANGDAANKIGTYAAAVAAHHHGVPFYVAAPLSTVDMALPTGDGIPIEERDPAEVTCIAGVRLAPEGVPAWNPSFDVTPAALIAAIITDQGVVRPPFGPGLARLADRAAAQGGAS